MTAQDTAAPPAPDTLAVFAVAWDDERAVALRGHMTTELHARYIDLITELVEDPEQVGEALKDDISPEIVAHTVIAELGGIPVGHAALIRSRHDAHPGELEVKRVYTADAARRRGVSVALLAALERWAADQGAERVILGTGPEQPEAVALYGKTGYERIASFAPEPWKDLVYCFEKRL
ncbi:MAG: GNAT family N-acetyltransferase [Solirubrobacteraceae bacterium]|nr:GNAT family N-acetyltransferase [Patulibacter sp.]